MSKPIIEPDDAIATLQEMFEGNRLEEYEKSFDVLVKAYYALCEENRKRLHTEVRKSA
ncbi:hypothetical protein MO973_19685 [Paenibacillus sp. TRM 82003]|nr:hypothetical protein [Paenibacillus sp. TRM 82003]